MQILKREWTFFIIVGHCAFTQMCLSIDIAIKGLLRQIVLPLHLHFYHFPPLFRLALSLCRKQSWKKQLEQRW